MRLSLKVNGNPRVVAAVNGPGYLSAHLNLCERPKDNDYSKTVRVVGIQTLETETVRLEWPELVLQVGDTAELSLLNDGEGPVPSEDRPNRHRIYSHIPNSQGRYCRWFRILSRVSCRCSTNPRPSKWRKNTNGAHWQLDTYCPSLVTACCRPSIDYTRSLCLRALKASFCSPF